MYIITSITIGDTLCNNANECEDEYITDKAICSGYKGCNKATIDSTESVTCSGPFSCANSPHLYSNTGIDCLGPMSCKDSDSIMVTTASATINCNNFESCSNTKITKTSSDNNNPILCSAINSCKNSEIIAPNIMCSGSSSCAQCNITVDTLQCIGSLSCSQIIANVDKLTCDGPASCSNAISIVVKTELTPFAAYAMVNTQSIITPKLISTGYKSVANSRIDSSSLSNVLIAFLGWKTGDETKILCRSGSICSLICTFTGCINVKYLCLSQSKCHIDPIECMQHENMGNYVKGNKCPSDITISTSAQQDELLLIEYNKNEVVDISFNNNQLKGKTVVQNLLKEIHIAENTGTDHVLYKCKNADSCKGLEITLDSRYKYASFMGPNSCELCSILYANMIDCYGDNSCKNAIQIHGTGMHKNDIIRCGGYQSCINAKLIYNEYSGIVACTGQESCKYVGLIESKLGGIICSNIESCSYSNIRAYGTIFCSSERSCFNSNITTRDRITCSSYRSCESGTIKADNINCLGKQSCSMTHIQAKTVRAYAAPLAIITAQEIDVVSTLEHGGIRYGIIDSGNYEVVNYKLYGYLIGYKAKITCNSGSICNIYCGGNGCKGLTIYCLHRSTCNIFPDTCMDMDNYNNMDGDIRSDYISCPEIITSHSAEDDVNLLSKRDMEIKQDQQEAINDLKMSRDYSLYGKDIENKYYHETKKNHRLYQIVSVCLTASIVVLIAICIVMIVWKYITRSATDIEPVHNEKSPLLNVM